MVKPLAIADVIRCERDALAIETRISQCLPFVAVNKMDDVALLPTTLRWAHKATIRALPQAKSSSFIVECTTLNSNVLWVGTNNDYYRRDYLTFLNDIYQLGLSAIPVPYDVDHLYNRSRAQTYGLKFIRLALVGHAANRSHGAAYEKDITRNEALRVRRDMKLMDEITSMKYFGFLSPLRDDPREEEISAYVTFAAAQLGIDPVTVRKSVMYLREKASKAWAAKK
jgi:hypothetical protein